MRFIHLADVHLGAVPDRGCPWSKEREEEIWSTFRRVIAGIREEDRKSTRLNSSHLAKSRMPSSA